ncbi:MAG: RNA polymerase sigma factor [Candidatus Sericytochromatia bacterium]
MEENIIKITDEELMLKVINGDKKSFYTLVNRWNKPIINFFYKNTLNQELAEELAQDVFINVWKSKNYSVKANFYSWLYKIAKNKLIDYKRKNKLNLVSIDNNPEFLDELMTNSDDLENNLIKLEELKMVQKTIFNLDEEQKQLLIMSKYQKLKYDDISKILNCSTDNVKVKVFRAVKNFVKKFQELYGEYKNEK